MSTLPPKPARVGAMGKEELNSIVQRGLEAVDADDLDTAQKELDAASGVAGESDPRVLHLSGMLAWAQGDVDRAMGFLLQSVDAQPEPVEIYLDCAECVFMNGDDLDEAEAVVRTALKLPTATGQKRDEAHLLLAQIRLSDDDVDEALESLSSIDSGLHGHPAYLSTHAAVLMAAGKTADAVGQLEKAVEAEPEDADLHYQLGITRRAAGNEEGATESLVRVLALDTAEAEADGAPPAFAESQDLRTHLEDLMEEMPDPLLRLVASAPITVQARATEDQVKQGVDPRSTVVFLGRRAQSHGDEDAELAGIVVMRDLLVAEIGDDDEIPEALFAGLSDELRDFYRRDDVFFDATEV